MKKIITISIIFIILLGIVTSCEPAEEALNMNGVKMTAIIKNLNGKIEVEVIEDEYNGAGLYWLNVSNETVFADENNETIRRSELKVGDVVKVSGTTSVYGGAKQFGQGTEVTVLENGTVETPTAVELSAAELDAYATASDIAPIYVKVTGTLAVSGNYYNFTMDGCTIVGSFSYPAGAIKEALDAQAGNTFSVEGYIIGTASSGKYLTILVTDILA